MIRYFRALLIAATLFSLPVQAFQVIDGQIYDQDGKMYNCVALTGLVLRPMIICCMAYGRETGKR